MHFVYYKTWEIADILYEILSFINALTMLNVILQ